MAHNLVTPYLGHEPKAKVATKKNSVTRLNEGGGRTCVLILGINGVVVPPLTTPP